MVLSLSLKCHFSAHFEQAGSVFLIPKAQLLDWKDWDKQFMDFSLRQTGEGRFGTSLTTLLYTPSVCFLTNPHWEIFKSSWPASESNVSTAAQF